MISVFRRKNHARILMHRPGADVYIDGRYMRVDAKLSVKSRRDRQIARELAAAILREVDTPAGMPPSMPAHEHKPDQEV